MRKIELLAPAGSLEVLKTAVRYGADAVYIGGEAYGLRAKARNFSLEEMKEGVRLAHAHGVKVYVTANIFARNGDLEGVEAYFRELGDVGMDALIISDPGVFALARRILPRTDVHISTQANSTNYAAFRFWYRLGAKRVVAARELSLAEIARIRAEIPADREIECFVHGAMCISYSGRCLLSNYFTGRDANRGECTHPCRWNYAVVEETRPGEYLPVYENERGTFLFNSKDLCMIGHIPELLAAGIDSFKIEGRMKNSLYVATVVRAYRKAIDDCLKSEETYRENLPWYMEEVGKCTRREFTTGFYCVETHDGMAGAGMARRDESVREKERAAEAQRGDGVRCGLLEARRDDSIQEKEQAAEARCSDGVWETKQVAELQRGDEIQNGKPGAEAQIYGASTYRKEYVYLGTVDCVGERGLCRLEQKNKFSVGETVEIMKPDGRNVQARVGGIRDEEGRPQESAPHARQIVYVDLGGEAEAGDVLRRRDSRN